MTFNYKHKKTGIEHKSLVQYQLVKISTCLLLQILSQWALHLLQALSHALGIELRTLE